MNPMNVHEHSRRLRLAAPKQAVPEPLPPHLVPGCAQSLRRTHPAHFHAIYHPETLRNVASPKTMIMCSHVHGS